MFLKRLTTVDRTLRLPSCDILRSAGAVCLLIGSIPCHRYIGSNAGTSASVACRRPETQARRIVDAPPFTPKLGHMELLSTRRGRHPVEPFASQGAIPSGYIVSQPRGSFVAIYLLYCAYVRVALQLVLRLWTWPRIGIVRRVTSPAKSACTTRLGQDGLRIRDPIHPRHNLSMVGLILSSCQHCHLPLTLYHNPTRRHRLFASAVIILQHSISNHSRTITGLPYTSSLTLMTTI